jgi:hypothetical protein
VAAVIDAHAKPGDIIALCPDQLGPAVYRAVAHTGSYTMVTFPRGTGPQFVDWVRYASAVAAGRPKAFASKLVADAGSDHRIWLVWQPGYQTYGIKCEQIASILLSEPHWGGHNWVSPNGAKYYEPMTLTEYAPQNGSSG